MTSPNYSGPRSCTCGFIRIPSGRHTGARRWSADCRLHGIGTRFMREPEAVLDWQRTVEEIRARRQRNVHRPVATFVAQDRYL